MKTLPAGLAAHLAGDATTICHCWRVTRSDGVILGFTEHDRDLRFAGTTFLAASGFRASEDEAGRGLAAEAGEVAGGFSSDVISEADVLAGRYDGARVEVFAVNWQAPDQHVLLHIREIGDVVLAGGAFRAELRRLTHRLDQVRGRIYGRRCDAMLGDGRCGVDLTRADYRGEGSVVAVDGDTRMVVSGIGEWPGGFFRHGLIRFGNGANAGRGFEVDEHARIGSETVLTLWLPPARPVAAGDTFTVTAGCDKLFGTCGEKFGNRINFQGFPHMPGSDFAFGYADGGTVHDGRPLYE